MSEAVRVGQGVEVNGMAEPAIVFLALLGSSAFLLVLLGLGAQRIGLFRERHPARRPMALAYGAAAVVLTLSSLFLLYEPDEARIWDERGEAILAQMQVDYEAGHYTAVIDTADRYMEYAEPEAPVEVLHDRALEDSLGESERMESAAAAAKNRDLYRRLVNFDAANERYVSKLIHYEVRYEVEQERKQAQHRAKESGEQPSRNVRNYYVEHAVKDRLANPDSFEHIRTRFADRGERLYVTMQFREDSASEVDTAYAVVSLEKQLTVLIIK